MYIDCQTAAAPAQVARHRRQFRIARKRFEHRIEVVHRVADLVDRQRLGLLQLAVRAEGFLLEEAAHRVVRAEEPGVAGAFLVARGEDGARFGRVEGVDDGFGACAQGAISSALLKSGMTM
jgi:hypothetical protein